MRIARLAVLSCLVLPSLARPTSLVQPPNERQRLRHAAISNALTTTADVETVLNAVCPRTSAGRPQHTRLDTLLASLHAPAKQAPFALIMQGNAALKDLLLNWICNTKQMPDVHNRTLVITSAGATYDAVTAAAPHIAVIGCPQRDDGLDRSFQFGTYGYWKLTHERVQSLLNVLRLGVSLLNWEPDAFWARNPLEDAELATADADVVIGRDRVPLAFNFVRVKANAKTVRLFAELMDRLNASIKRFGSRPSLDAFDLAVDLQEQVILERLLKDKFAGVTSHILNECKYATGVWYADESERRQCLLTHGSPVVINNNFVFGNDAKVERARQWKQWFLGERGQCHEVKVAQAMASTLLSAACA